MNELFFISAYGHEANVWRRFLISAPSAIAAMTEFDEYIADSGWERKRFVYVAKTPDAVFMEL